MPGGNLPGYPLREISVRFNRINLIDSGFSHWRLWCLTPEPVLWIDDCQPVDPRDPADRT